MTEGIINIKTVGRFTIDYCRVPIRVDNPAYEGIVGGTIKFAIFLLSYQLPPLVEVPGIYVYLHAKDERLITIESFLLSKDPEENKKRMAGAVRILELKAVELNKKYDKKERDERIMLSGVMS